MCRKSIAFRFYFITFSFCPVSYLTLLRMNHKFPELLFLGRLKKVRFEVGELAAKISGVTDKVRAAHAIWVRLKASGPD